MMDEVLRFRPRQEPGDTEFDISQLIAEVCAELEPRMMRGEVDVEIDAPPHTIVMADRQALCAILEQLLGQAIQMTPPKREIVVTVYDEEDGLDVEIAEGSAIFARELDQADPTAVSAVLNADPQIRAAGGMIELMAGTLDVVECADGAVAFNVHLPRERQVEKDVRKVA